MQFRKKRLLSQKRIYADAAAATPLSARAKKELVRLLSVYGNAGALHREALDAKKEMEKARAIIAACIGAHPDEIIFTASGTEANNLAINGIIRPLLKTRDLDVGPHAITCAIEHQSVLEPLRALTEDGLSLTELPVDSHGFVSSKQLAEAVTDGTVFVSVQLVNSEIGTIEPVREIAKEIRRARQNRASLLGRSGPLGRSIPSLQGAVLPIANLPLYFHTDASQAPLWMPISVENLGVDLLTLDAQKVLGPKGIGALYVKRGTPLAPFIRGGVQESGLRAGTPNTPLVGAFAVALADAQKGLAERAQKVSAVRDFLMQEIKRLIPDAIFNGPDLKGDALKASSLDERVANNINVSIPGLDAEMAVVALDTAGIAASTRSACNTTDEEPSHVIKALQQSRPDLNSGSSRSDIRPSNAIRITLLPNANKRQASRIAHALCNIEKKYSSRYN